MKNYVLKYGLIAGIINITLGLSNWFTIAQAFGPSISQTVGYLSMVLSLMCIPLGIKYFRDKINNGNVSFAKGFRVGLGITLIASVITFFYSALFFVFAGDSFDEWSKKGLSASELEAYELRLVQTPDFVFTPWFQGLILFLSVFMIGSIINLISSLVLRRSTN